MWLPCLTTLQLLLISLQKKVWPIWCVGVLVCLCACMLVCFKFAAHSFSRDAGWTGVCNSPKIAIALAVQSLCEHLSS